MWPEDQRCKFGKLQQGYLGRRHASFKRITDGEVILECSLKIASLQKRLLIISSGFLDVSFLLASCIFQEVMEQG